MSKVVLAAFVAATGLAVAAVDYVDQSRRVGLEPGTLRAVDYADGLMVRLGLLSRTAATVDGRAGVGRPAVRFPLADLGGVLDFLSGSGPIDMVAFDATVKQSRRAGAPSGELSFSSADATGPAAGSCLSNGAFKRCRVGN